MVKKSRLGLAESHGSRFSELHLKDEPREGLSSPLTWLAVSLKMLLAVGYKHQFLSCTLSTGHSQHGIWLPSRQGLRERDNERKTMREPVRWKSQSLCNLISEETPHHFCWILFFFFSFSFFYDIIHVLMPSSQIIPPSQSYSLEVSHDV